MAQAKRVGQEGRRQQDGIGGADRQRDEPRTNVEHDQHGIDADQAMAQVAGARGEALNRRKHAGLILLLAVRSLVERAPFCNRSQ